MYVDKQEGKSPLLEKLIKAILANKALTLQLAERDAEIQRLRDALDAAILEIRIWSNCYGDQRAKDVAHSVVENLRSVLSHQTEQPDTQAHYLIIGEHIKVPIGCCSEEGKEDVLVEEPGYTFERVDIDQCPVCSESSRRQPAPKGEDSTCK